MTSFMTASIGSIYPARIQAGGGVSLDYGPVSGLTLTPSATGIGISFNPKSAASGPGARYLVETLTARDKAETNVNHPFRWQRLTFIPSAQVSYTYRDALELEAVDVRVTTVAPDGTLSAPALSTTTTPQWAPQNHLSLWSEDFTQGNTNSGIWSRDTGVIAPTVAAGGGQLITLGAASRTIGQLVPTYIVANRTYTLRVTARAAIAGDVGKTIQIINHSVDDSVYNDKLITLAAADTVYTHEITFGPALTGRNIQIGVNSYGTSTATNVIVTRMQLHAGTAAALPAYEVTSGPGSTWHEPLFMRNGAWWYVLANSTGYTGWHRSLINGVHAIQSGNAISDGRLNLQSCRTVSMSGAHIKFDYPNNAGLICNNHRAFGLHPGANDQARGLFFMGDYMRRLEVTNCFSDHTGGIRTQFFQGNGGTDTIKILRNRLLDTDGRRASAVAGGYVLSPYSNLTQSTPVGFNAVSNIGIHGIQNTLGVLDGMEIAYNEFYQRPGMGRVEDSFNLSGFAGTAISPIRIHHNLIQRYPWDYAWFAAQPGSPARTYSMAAIGTVGDVNYSANSYDSGSAGMPVDSNMHEWDPNQNGKNIEVYQNWIVGNACTQGLLDGQNVRLRDQIFVASGNLPDSAAPISGAGKVCGFQITSYPQGQVTLQTAALATDTSITVTSDTANNFFGGNISYQMLSFSNGVNVTVNGNSVGITGTSLPIYNVSGAVPVGTTLVIKQAQCYCTLTVAGTALTTASTIMTFTLTTVTSGFRAGGYIKFANGVRGQITAATPFAASNLVSVTLSGAVPAGTLGDYVDGYMSNNTVAENTIRTPSGNSVNDAITLGILTSAFSRDNVYAGASSNLDEWQAHADHASALLLAGVTLGPT